jgi:phage gp29-like protein
VTSVPQLSEIEEAAELDVEDEKTSVPAVSETENVMIKSDMEDSVSDVEFKTPPESDYENENININHMGDNNGDGVIASNVPNHVKSQV